MTTSYDYDIANRLISVNGQAYTWDNNGNLLNDGTNTYTYDAANRLTSVSNQSSVSSYQYNGLGDRLSQTVNGVTTNYTLDLNVGLTQVLADGTNAYLYGNGRIGELQPGGFAYHLDDALGSVRQLADAEGEVTLARAYEPFGNTLTSTGNGSTVWQFTGEARDASGLTFLRARYLSTSQGRFVSRDSWEGDYGSPTSLNKYLYANGNPVLYTDPTGQWCVMGVSWGDGAPCTTQEHEKWARTYNAALNRYNWAVTKSQALVDFSAGFLQEYLDNVVAGIPLASLVILGICGDTAEIRYYKNSNQDVVAGRYAARFFLAHQAALELGIGAAGLIFGGGLTIGTGGAGAIAGVPVATLSAVLVGHGALVLGALALKQQVDPLPPLYHQATTGEGNGQVPRPGYSGPSEGYTNKNSGDLHPQPGTPLEEALASQDYKTPSRLIGGDPSLKNTAKYIYVIDKNGVILV